MHRGTRTASEDVAITSGLFATDGRDRSHGTPLALHICYKFPSVPLPVIPFCSSLLTASVLPDRINVGTRSARKKLLWELRDTGFATLPLGRPPTRFHIPDILNLHENVNHSYDLSQAYRETLSSAEKSKGIRDKAPRYYTSVPRRNVPQCTLQLSREVTEIILPK